MGASTAADTTSGTYSGTAGATANDAASGAAAQLPRQIVERVEITGSWTTDALDWLAKGPIDRNSASGAIWMGMMAMPDLSRGVSATRGVTAGASRVALRAPTEVNPWRGASVSGPLQTDMTMYRVWGGEASQAGSWLTPVMPESASLARAGLALPAANSAAYVSEVLVPAGTWVQAGIANPAFGQLGGMVQIRLLSNIPLANFRIGLPLIP